jgi:hypothetical protein
LAVDGGADGCSLQKNKERLVIFGFSERLL